MKGKASLSVTLVDLLKEYSVAEIEEALRATQAVATVPDICTILVNKGPHVFPDYLFRGEMFIFYEGSADLSSGEALEAFTIERLRRLAKFLRKRKWKSIDIVISGQAALCMQVKLAVYRVTHLETTDWVFDGEGRYVPLRISLRSVLTSALSEDAS